jgi:hypothetical protein
LQLFSATHDGHFVDISSWKKLIFYFAAISNLCVSAAKMIFGLILFTSTIRSQLSKLGGKWPPAAAAAAVTVTLGHNPAGGFSDFNVTAAGNFGRQLRPLRPRQKKRERGGGGGVGIVLCVAFLPRELFAPPLISASSSFSAAVVR